MKIEASLLLKVLKTLTYSTVVTCTFTSLALAGGYQILEQSGEGVGVGFAGATAGYGDGSEIAWNPAAMAWIDGTQANHASHLIISSAEFSNAGSSNVSTGVPTVGGNGGDGGGTSYVPNVYVVSQMRDDLHVGFGINAPFGLRTDYDDGWVGRYHGLKSDLLTVNLMPAVSYEPIENFAFGAGLDIMYLDVEVSNAIDFGTIGVATLGAPTASSLGLLPQQADGKATAEGDDWATGFHIGGAYRYGNRSRVGVSWHSRMLVDIEGDARFDVPANAQALTTNGLFTDTGATADITLPEYVNIGWIHNLNNQWSVLAEAQWTRWSRFEELRIAFDGPQPDSVTDESWENTWRFSLAGQYHPTEKLTLSAGAVYDETPIPDDERRTPRIPGNDRKWLTAGAKYRFLDNLSVGFSYAHIFVSDSTSNIVNSTGDNLVGDWDAHVDLVNLYLTYGF